MLSAISAGYAYTEKPDSMVMENLAPKKPHTVCCRKKGEISLNWQKMTNIWIYLTGSFL